MIPQRLYGRTAEVTALIQAFAKVCANGRSQLLLVSGYAGGAKSALVQELREPVVVRGALFLVGKFDQYKRDISRRSERRLTPERASAGGSNS